VTIRVDFSNVVLSEMEDELQVDAVYTDFSKVFDRVNHDQQKPKDGEMERTFRRTLEQRLRIEVTNTSSQFER
jgi:hypothetical protein